MKKILVGALVICLALGMTACGGNGSEGESGGGDSDGGILGRVDKMLGAQGRSYDELVTGSIGDTLTSTFFDFSITNVEAADELDGNIPTEGKKFIVADVTVKNIFVNSEGDKEAIPVGNYDFTIIWNSEAELSDEDQMGYEAFMDGMYPDDETLEPDAELSGKLVFEVPVDVNDFGIAYAEIWDDEFEGDTYVVECKL